VKMRSFLFLAAVAMGLTFAAGAAWAQCRVTETRIGDEAAVVLENRLVRLQLRPAHGGRIDQLVHKPTAKHLTAQGDGKVFIDRVWNYADAAVYRQWTDAVYAHKLTQGSNEAKVTLTCRGSVGIGKRLTFEKTFSLTAGCAAVRADYVISLGHEAMVPKPVGVWWHNRLGVPQEATTYYIPTSQGVQSVAYGAGAAGQYWWYDLARGWGAALGDGGTGVAVVMDYRKLMCFYNYMSGDVAGMEWAYRSEDIPNGGAATTTMWLVPFAGLTAVNGAAQDVVGEIAVPASVNIAQADEGMPVTVRLAAPRTWQAAARLTWQRLPDGDVTELARWDARLSTSSVSEKRLQLKLTEAGTYVLRTEVLRGDELVADLLASVVVGKASAEVTIDPLQKRLGRVDERFEDKIASKGNAPQDRPPSESVVTPHVKWAKPLATGGLKTLILNDVLTERETVELAQRVDMDYTAPTVASPGYIRNSGARLGRALTFEQAQENVARHLKDDFDVIAIGGLSGKILTDDMVETLMDKVRAGTGLVWVNPNNCPEAVWQVLPLSGPPGGARGRKQWQASEEHYLTTGIPWAAMPPVSMSRYKAAGHVLATAGDLPLLTVGELGKGRIVCLSYATSWQAPGFHKNGLTPWVQYAAAKFGYWEYYFSLLGKCMIWAGQKQPDVQFGPTAAGVAGYEIGSREQPTLTPTLTNSGAAAELVAHVTVQDEYGHRVTTFEHAFRAEPGKSEITFTLPRLAGGLHVADIIAKDSEGTVVDWTSVPVRVRAPVMIKELAVDDDVYRVGDTVTAQVALTCTAGGADSVQLRATLTDAHDRLVWIGERAATGTSTGTDSACDLTVELPEPRTTTALLRVEAHAAGKLLHAAEQRILTMPPSWDSREWEPFSSGLWGNPVGAYSREYLMPVQAALIKAVGVDTVITGGRWLHDGEQRAPFEAGFRTMPMGVAARTLGTRRRSKDHLSFAQQKAAYLRTRDKKHLERPWCLNAEETCEHVRENLKRITQAVARYRPLGYVCGDELSLTDHTQPLDYDFSPAALAAFRDWLKDCYPSLADLNRGWDTSFVSWEAVMPMTAEEVSDRGNYAPWADHRTFMEVSLAEYLRFIDDVLEKHDPGARLGTSGTQAASAYGGHDWWLLTDAFDFIQAYDHQDTGEMHRSFHDMIAAPWWGYGAHGSALQHQLWRRLLNNNRGASYFSLNSLLCGDYTYTKTISEGMGTVKEFKAGLARLLHDCEERVADVCMHYSQPSIHGVFITGGNALFRANRHGWIKAVEDSGMQTEFVSYAQVESGALTTRMPSVFILPYSLALSDAEAAELREYVQAGGTLVADARCGLFDEHCAPRSQGALDELFGVTRTEVNAKAKRISGDVTFTASHGDCDPRDLKFACMSGDTMVNVTDDTALGTLAKTPVLIVRNVGKGRAILLNLFMDEYGKRRKTREAGSLRELVRRVLGLGGARAFADVVAAPGDRFYTVRYVKGAASYIGLLREPGTILTGGGPGSAQTGKADRDSPVQMTFAKEAYVYDLRAAKYLGKTDRVEALMAPGQCRVYSLLPYRVRAVRVSPETRTVRPGDVVRYATKVRTRGGKPGRHVFRVDVESPDGPKPFYGTQFAADAGAGSAAFRLALNDALGTWRLQVTDIATGTTDETTFRVR
jgi:hypothetical protein